MWTLKNTPDIEDREKECEPRKNNRQHREGRCQNMENCAV